jgi:HTH-like domain
VVGQHRSTQRLDPPVIDDDERQLREFLCDFARRRPRWGWRRAAKDARRAGWPVNDKRVRRLWHDEGLKVPYKRRKKRVTEIGVHVGAMCPIRPNALWAMDFQFDVTVEGPHHKGAQRHRRVHPRVPSDRRRPLHRRRRCRRRPGPAHRRTRCARVRPLAR